MFKKIILTVIAISIAIVAIIFINNSNNSNDITVEVEIVYNDNIKNTDIFIPNNSTFLIELKKVYDITIEDGFIYKIDFLDLSESSSAYIAIYVNDKYSQYGITNLKLNDKDKVSFIYTEL